MEVHADGESIALTVEGTTEKLTASQCEELIAVLWRARAGTTPAVPNEPPNADLDGVLDPRFFVNEDLMRGGAIFRVRHPGLGWLAFWWPASSAAQLANLIAQFGVKSPDQGGTRQ